MNMPELPSRRSRFDVISGFAIGLALVSLGLAGCGSSSPGGGSDAGPSSAGGGDGGIHSMGGAAGGTGGAAGGSGGAGGGTGGAAGGIGGAVGGTSGAAGGTSGAAGGTGGALGGTSGAAGGTSGAAGGTSGAAGGTSGAAGGIGGAAGGIGGAAGTGAGPNGLPSTVYPAPHPALPQIVNLGGPVLANPRFQAVTFAGDDPTVTAALEDFLQRVGATTYFADNTSQYAVGSATAETSISLTEAAPALTDDEQIQTWLAGNLTGANPAFGTVDANTLFVLIYPAATEVSVGSQQGCVSFGSYHSELTLDSAHANAAVPYVVLPRCSSFNGLTGIAAATAALSTALLDAVTDPDSITNSAWVETDQNHVAWATAAGGGEICSLCALEPESFGLLSEIPYTAERCWSNLAAAAGHDPCVPAPSGVSYFNAMPVLPDTVNFEGVATAAVQIPAGTSRTIAVDLFSDAATSGPISVSALDYAASMGKPPVLTLALDSATGLNGQHLNLTVTVPATAIQPAMFYLTSTVGGVMHVSVGLVGN
jgi:hypothetical protein